MIQAELACSSLLGSWTGKVSASSKDVFHCAGKLGATLATGDALGETRADSESVKPTSIPIRLADPNQFKLESGRFADTLSVYQWSQPLPVCQEPIQCLARSSWVQYRVRGA